MQSRGNLLMLAGRPEEAIPLMERAIVGFAKFTGKDSPDVIAASLGLAQAKFAVGHKPEAEHLFDTAARMIHDKYPTDARLAKRLVNYRANTEKILAGNRPHCGS